MFLFTCRTFNCYLLLTWWWKRGGELRAEGFWMDRGGGMVKINEFCDRTKDIWLKIKINPDLKKARKKSFWTIISFFFFLSFFLYPSTVNLLFLFPLCSFFPLFSAFYCCSFVSIHLYYKTLRSYTYVSYSWQNGWTKFPDYLARYTGDT